MRLNSGSFTQSAVPETGARFRPISPYVQDTWRVTSKLTLDLGLRWDYYPSYREVKDRFAYFDPNATNPLIGSEGRDCLRRLRRPARATAAPR